MELLEKVLDGLGSEFDLDDCENMSNLIRTARLTRSGAEAVRNPPTLLLSALTMAAASLLWNRSVLY